MLRPSLLAFVLVAVAGCADAAPQSLKSPDGRVEIVVDADPVTGGPVYTVRHHGRPVIAPSPLGLMFEGYRKIGPGLVQTGTERRAADTRYTLVAGKTATARDHYQELVLHYAEPDDARRKLDIVLRAYDDGVAFRYRVPAQAGFAPDFRLANELTEFATAPDDRCFGLNLGKFGTSHEGEYDPFVPAMVRTHNLYELPVTCRTAGGSSYAIAEADLHDYAGLYLMGRETGAPGFAAKLSPRIDDPKIAVKADIARTPIETPWRVVMLGDTPGALIESTILTSLNPAPDGDFSWVKPGKSAWDWWNGPTLSTVPKAGMNAATIKAYIDFAAASGLDYMLIDEGWSVNSGGGGTVYPGADIMKTVPEIDLPALVRYAADRKVGLWLWANWQVLARDMDRAVPFYAKMGIKGFKVDFMDRDDQQMVDFFHRMFRLTADNHMMLDLHGAYHPTGAIRTWPHYLTQEGVLGAEYNKWTRRITARHNVTLPFTRGLAGPYDYTPGGFRNATPQTFRIEPQTPMVQTTRGQALAMYVAFDSPFQIVADSPDNYRDAAGFDFIRTVPASWDETRVLAGEIGEQILIARRKGKDWYVGAMTNETGRTMDVPLGFLGSGRFTATRWQDAAAPTDVKRDVTTVQAGDRMRLVLAASGGAVVKLSPAR